MHPKNEPGQAPTPAGTLLRIFLGLALVAVASVEGSAVPLITTYVGGGTNGNYSPTIGFPATNAYLVGIEDVAVDLLGNVFIANATSAAMVTRVDHATGLITRFAGTGVMGSSGDGGAASDAQFMLPKSLAVDLSGNVYVLDQVDNRVRTIDVATGLIHTVAGNGIPDFTGEGGPATNASLNTPSSIAVDVHGNLYIADTFNFVVRKVDAASGIIRGIAGQYPNPGYTGDGGRATNARVGMIQAIAVDASDNVFLLDGVTPQHVRRIDGVTGIITTIAGGGAGDGASGFATNVNLNFANDLAVENLGGLYIGGSSQVWKVDLASGTISIVTGGPTPGFGGDGGPASAALVSSVLGLAVSGTGGLYLADYGNDRVRKVSADRGHFAVNWFKIAGGGGGSGGLHPLVGTMGQADAGGPLTGARFSVVGGFWALPVAVQVPGAPTLKIVWASPDVATISWTPNTLGFVLQEASSLSPANWTNSPSAVTNPVTVPAGSPAKFYRLTKP